MADFNTAINFVLQNEDSTHSYATVKDSPPGAYAISGINSAAFPDQFVVINSIPQAQRGPAVLDFYKQEFWNKWYSQLISDDLACRVLDTAVNNGPGTAVKLLQLALNSIGTPTLNVDGEWGPATLAAANYADPKSLLTAFRLARVNHYQAIVAKNPDNAKYLNVWLARAKQ